MNKNKQNTEIAKLCGWKLKWQNCGGAPLLDTKPTGFSWEVWIPPQEDKEAWKQIFEQESVCPPDYCESLDAIHEVEKIIIIKNQDKLGLLYSQTLFDICNQGDCVSSTNMLFATASQRAEALLKTLNLWKNEF